MTGTREDKPGKFQLFLEKITANDSVGLQELMKIHQVKVDDEDETGMTLLQHAAFKGKVDMCQLLLDMGANPNGGHHEHKYSTLHFAALSGKAQVCQLLLQYGCSSDSINSVGRTAAQMAAFVGNHQCVSVINNFIPREDVDVYTQPQNGRAPKLSPTVAPAVHRLIMQTNLNPVYLIMIIQKLPLIWEHLTSIGEVLDQMSEGQMKRGRETNELLSLKLHHLHFLVVSLDREKQKKQQTSMTELTSNMIKLLLKPRASDGFPEYLDNFIRESIRTFPFKETTVFRQLLVNLSKTKQETGSSLAIQLLTSCINGQRGFGEEDPCPTCGQEKATMKCSQCKAARYCDRQCQKFHWPHHKKECTDLAAHLQQTSVPSDPQPAS